MEVRSTAFLRQRRGFGAFGHRRELGVHFIGHFLKLLFGQIAFCNQLFFEPFDRTLLLPRLDFFLGPIGGSWIAAKVAVPTVSDAFKKRRTIAVACL